MENILQRFGQRLKSLRKEKGLKQIEMAEKLDDLGKGDFEDEKNQKSVYDAGIGGITGRDDGLWKQHHE